MSFSTVLSLMGGLGLFLFGINIMGDGLEQAAGNRMKKLLEVLTKNRFVGMLVGLFVTAVIQSSSATTVMVVGFVNAGLLQLAQAIGVIMGANVGTTVTSLMLSVDLDFSMIFCAIGAVCLLAGNRSGLKTLGQIMLGLGMLFVGMDTMSEAMKPLRDWDGFRNMMAAASNPVVGVLVGAVVTAVVQSSSASVGILQAVAATGAISLQGCMYILFGQNIGTCITAMLASVGTNRTAKRAAVVHLLFNCIGTLVFMVIASLLPLADWVQTMAGDNQRFQIALVHIIFNVTMTVLLLPAAPLLEKLACLIVRGDADLQEPMKLCHFDTRLFSTPPVAVQQLFREVQRMADIVTENFRFAMDYFFDPKDKDINDFNHQEEVVDYLNAEITQHLIEAKGLSLNNNDNRLAGSLFHVVNDLERIGDHCVNIIDIADARAKEKTAFSSKAEAEIQQLSDMVVTMLEKSISIVKAQITDVDVIGEVIQLESKVDDLSEQLAAHHVDRVKNKKCTPKNGMLYLDMMNNLERIADHADNLAASVEKKETNTLLW
ncbi:MAG: Na/Pi cotransporter family protein [Clostridiales bacterium]|nr:Na/Pi cotransporter family protein [Clostridiales bacterium]